MHHDSVFQKTHEGTATASVVCLFWVPLLGHLSVVTSCHGADFLGFLESVSALLITSGFFGMPAVYKLSLDVIDAFKNRGEGLVDTLHFSGKRAFDVPQPVLHRRFKLRKIARETSHSAAYEFLQILFALPKSNHFYSSKRKLDMKLVLPHLAYRFACTGESSG